MPRRAGGCAGLWLLLTRPSLPTSRGGRGVRGPSPGQLGRSEDARGHGARAGRGGRCTSSRFCRRRAGRWGVSPANGPPHGWDPTSARPGASPGVCTERGARQPPPRLSAHCGRACAKGPGVTSEDRVGEESQCPRGSRSTCVGVGGGQLCGGGGVLRSPEVLTPRLGALSGVSSRLGVIRPPLPAEASRRLRQPSVTGIPATWARAAPETPLARRLRRAAANTCGGRGPAPRSAQASPAAWPEQLITPAPGREALPGPLFSTCLPGACE